jgi:hypothetical protein
MRMILSFLPALLVTLGIPALAAQPETPNPTPRHLIQPLRPGAGQPRVRQGAAVQSAAQGGKVRTRAYQAAKPGEGAPKG